MHQCERSTHDNICSLTGTSLPLAFLFAVEGEKYQYPVPWSVISRAISSSSQVVDRYEFRLSGFDL